MFCKTCLPDRALNVHFKKFFILCKNKAFQEMVKRMFLIPCLKCIIFRTHVLCTLNIWCLIHAFNVRFISYVLHVYIYILNLHCTFGCVLLCTQHHLKYHPLVSYIACYRTYWLICSMQKKNYHHVSDHPPYSFTLPLTANWLEAKTKILRKFLARYRNFLPQVDQKVHQVLQNLPHAFCFGDARRHDSINRKKKL